VIYLGRYGRRLSLLEGVAEDAVVELVETTASGARGRYASLSSFVFDYKLSENKTSLSPP